MKQIDKIDWVLRDIEFNLEQIKDDLSELYDIVDPFNPDDALAKKLGAINDAIAEASNYIATEYGCIDDKSQDDAEYPSETEDDEGYCIDEDSNRE